MAPFASPEGEEMAAGAPTIRSRPPRMPRSLRLSPASVLLLAAATVGCIPVIRRSPPVEVKLEIGPPAHGLVLVVRSYVSGCEPVGDQHSDPSSLQVRRVLDMRPRLLLDSAGSSTVGVLSPLGACVAANDGLGFLLFGVGREPLYVHAAAPTTSRRVELAHYVSDAAWVAALEKRVHWLSSRGRLSVHGAPRPVSGADLTISDASRLRELTCQELHLILDSTDDVGVRQQGERLLLGARTGTYVVSPCSGTPEEYEDAPPNPKS